MTDNGEEPIMETTELTIDQAQARATAAQKEADQAEAAAQGAQREADDAEAAFNQLVTDVARKQVTAKKLADAKSQVEATRLRADALDVEADRAEAAARTARLEAMAAQLRHESHDSVDRALVLMETIETAVRELVEIENRRDAKTVELYRAVRAEGVQRHKHGQDPREEDAGLAWEDLTRIGIAGQVLHHRGRQVRTQTKAASNIVALALSHATEGQWHKLKPHVTITGRFDDAGQDTRGWVAGRLGA